MIISAGFDSAAGDPLGGLGVTPVGYSYMTEGLRSLSKNTIVVLEGGYSLKAISDSAEAVIRTLKIEKDDQENLEKLLAELSEGTYTSYSQLVTEAMIKPRESFRQMASKVAKTHIKAWPILEPLIVEKIRRKSSSHN